MTDLNREISKCAKCGKCRAVCPTFLVGRDETKVARGRIALLEALLDRKSVPSAYAKEILLSCYRCMRCVDACPCGMEVDRIVQEARNLLARRRGISPFYRLVFRHILPRRRLYDAMIALTRLLQGPLRKSRGQPLRHLPLLYSGRRSIPRPARRSALNSMREIIKGKGDLKVSLFLGCMINYVYPEIARSIAHILELHGVDVIIPKGQLCCGTPVLAYGDMEAARTLARRNLECLEAEKVDAVVLGCASCGLTMRRDYPMLLPGAADLAHKFVDISEFIDGQLGYSNLPLDEKVTYHDPCHLRWGRGVRDAPREILRRSCRFVEMERPDDCCGLGGAYSLTHYDVSCALGESKVDAIGGSGADIVATSCPGCILQIQDQLERRGRDTTVMHVAQIYELSYLKDRG